MNKQSKNCHHIPFLSQQTTLIKGKEAPHVIAMLKLKKPREQIDDFTSSCLFRLCKNNCLMPSPRRRKEDIP